MPKVDVVDINNQKVGEIELADEVFSAPVKEALLYEAVRHHMACQRRGTAKTKRRSEVAGSGKKLWRQKGTGRARMGPVRTPQRRGGGMAFAKRPREYRQALPTKMRRQARNQAVLAKIRSDDALIIDGLKVDTPKTAPFAKMLAAVKADRGCVFATNGIDFPVYKSGRNIPRTEITDVAGLNAYQILSRRKLIFTREAFGRFKEILGAGAGGEA